jgi:hypothetical protein
MDGAVKGVHINMKNNLALFGIKLVFLLHSSGPQGETE